MCARSHVFEPVFMFSEKFSKKENIYIYNLSLSLVLLLNDTISVIQFPVFSKIALRMRFTRSHQWRPQDWTSNDLWMHFGVGKLNISGLPLYDEIYIPCPVICDCLSNGLLIPFWSLARFRSSISFQFSISETGVGLLPIELVATDTANISIWGSICFLQALKEKGIFIIMQNLAMIIMEGQTVKLWGWIFVCTQLQGNKKPALGQFPPR